MEKFKDRTVLDYMDHKGKKCPYCGEEEASPDDSVESRDFNTMAVPCSCDSCGGEWHEIYTMINIVPA